jgi:mannose-6-phosphate isomerase-like protein (cupin superfamily)
MLVLRPAGGNAPGSALRSSAARRQAKRAGSGSSTCWILINGAGRGRWPPSRGARWSVPAPPTTLARSTRTPKPGGAGTAKSPESRPLWSSRTQDVQASHVGPVIQRLRDPPADATEMHVRRKESHEMTTIVPEQRTVVGRYRRELEVILARAPSGAAVVVGCAVPPGTCGPPLHIHAASDETFFVVSGVLLVHVDGRVATIPEGGLVHVSRGMPHTFAAAPGSPARFLMLHTPGKSGEFYSTAAHTVQDHNSRAHRPPGAALCMCLHAAITSAAPRLHRGHISWTSAAAAETMRYTGPDREEAHDGGPFPRCSPVRS